MAWVTTPDLDEISRLGTLDQNFQASGSVAWNQFIVVIITRVKKSEFLGA